MYMIINQVQLEAVTLLFFEKNPKKEICIEYKINLLRDRR